MRPEDDQDGFLQLNGTLDSFTFGGYPTLEPKSEPQTPENSSSVVCSECGIVIRNVTNLAVHIRRHLGYKPFVCPSCSYSGYDEDDVQRHIARGHPNNPGTRVGFRPDSDMEASVQELIEKTKSYGVPSKSTGGQSLKEESVMENLLKSSSLPCLLCNGIVGPQAINVLKHLKTHLSFRGFSCPSCSVLAATWVEFVSHLESVHPSDARLNRWCQESRTLVAEALVSLGSQAFRGRDQPSLPCVQCQSNVKWEDLKDHALQEAGCRPWICQACGTGFASIQSVIQHTRLLHPKSYPAISMASELCAELKTESRWAALELSFPSLAAEAIESIRADPMVHSMVNGNSLLGLGRPLPPLGEAGVKKTMTECQLCSAQIPTTLSGLMAHAKVHLAYKPLKCEYCTFRHFAMSKMKRHNTRVHPNRSVKVGYHPIPDIGRQIREMKLRCFGASPSVVPWIHSVESQVKDVPELRLELSDDSLLNGGDDDDDDDDDFMDTSGALPVTLSSPEDRTVEDEGFSDSQVPPYIQNPHVSKLLEQLVRGKNLDIPTTAPSMPGMDGRRSGIFPQMTSPEPGPLTPKSSGGETYDLTGMGKKVCIVCNTFIANNPSSFDNHACKHLDYKP